ncbi:MAG: SDR family NAD(P)-dependent oxidoreductase [Gammaproteobacteria bacterium]
MALRIKDKSVVITGAANGIGRAWAENFHKEGAKVIACDIDKGNLDTLSELGIKTIEVDVSKDLEVKRMIDFALSENGSLDVLFNNAGLGYGYQLEDSPEGAFEQHVAVHLFGCVYGMKYAIPIMKKQERGRIINTISRNAETNTPTTSAYSAAKAGIWSASRVTANEVSASNILINMLIPGPTNTKIWGRKVDHLQGPIETYPTAKMLATLEDGGPTSKVFWDEKIYPMFNENNEIVN